MEVSVVYFENLWRFVNNLKRGSGQYNFNKSRERQHNFPNVELRCI